MNPITIISILALILSTVTLAMKIFSSFDKALVNSVAHVKETLAEQSKDIENIKSENRIQDKVGNQNGKDIAVLQNDMINKTALLLRLESKIDKLLDK